MNAAPISTKASDQVVERMAEIIEAAGQTLPLPFSAHQFKKLNRVAQAMKRGHLIICERRGTQLHFEIRTP